MTTDLRLLGDWALWLTLVVASVIAGAAWWLYRREVRGVLPALRAAAVFLIVLMLAGPVLHHRRTIGELARILVFVDASKSMSVTDASMAQPRKLSLSHFNPTNWLGQAKLSNEITAVVEKFDATTRWQRIEPVVLDEQDGLVPQLKAKHNVELWAITGGEPQRWWSGDQSLTLPKQLPGKPDGDGSDLGAAIAARIGQQRDERCAVVLISDGQHNRGASPLETARLAGGRSIPVYTIGVGATERPNDLAILNVTAPESVFSEDRVKGEIWFKDDMPGGQAFMLKIDHDGEIVWEQALTTDRTHRRKVEFDFPIKELVAGKKLKSPEYSSFPMSMKVSLSALAGEKDSTNNVSQFRFRAVTEKRKLLLLDGRPRWEYRYLRNMFERDPQWEVNALVAGTELNDVWEHGDKPGQLPATKEALFAYDLIVFGEVPARLLSTNDLEWITEFVGTRGGGLILIDGQRGALRDYPKSFQPLFPVEWLTEASKDTPALLQLTDRGATFPALRLTSDAGANASLWKQLPAPHWVAPVKPLAGAETLAEALIGTKKQPAIVVRQFGAGKVWYMGIDETWRWRFEVADKYQDAFWHQVANTIMEPAYAAQNQFIALDAGTVNYEAGDAAEIRVRLRDERGRAITTGHPTAILTRDGKKVATVALTADEGGAFRGKTPALEPGRYEVRVDAGRLVPETPDLPVEIFVQLKGGDASSELAEFTCNEELLQQMAHVSGGEFYREEDAARLINQLDPLSKGRIEESETVLWQSWYWFVPIIALLTAEWILRKRTGLI